MPTTRYREVLAHGTTELNVVYTNDSVMVPRFLTYFKKWLQEAEENENFMWLDLEYTANQQGVAVIQLCFKRNVMIFQWASGIHYASVDIRNDKLKMRHNFGIEIPAHYHIDIQDKFKLEHERTSMAHMAVAVIDEEYADMRTKFPRYQHTKWEMTPLDGINIEYATKDAYVSYELYRNIRIMNYGQRHLASAPPVWGLSDDLDE
uniref:3'-5' exonuclease domain-containing protein n=1 Tax=Hordeum vulgare subsp. vulgare TaxID=112509 RepID=A0A8I6X2F0_HORVV